MSQRLSEVLACFQAEHYRALADLIESVDATDTGKFVAAMRHVSTFAGSSVREMCHDLGLTNVSEQYELWHIVLRRGALSWYVRDLRQRANMIEAFPDEQGKPEIPNDIPQRFLPPEAQPRT